jgi:hypothetical protein
MTVTSHKALEDQLRRERYASAPVEDAEIVEDCGEAFRNRPPNPATAQWDAAGDVDRGGDPEQVAPSDILDEFCPCRTPLRRHLRSEHYEKDWLAANTPPGSEYVVVHAGRGTPRPKIVARRFGHRPPDLSQPLESHDEWRDRIRRVDARTPRLQPSAEEWERDKEAAFWSEIEQRYQEPGPDFSYHTAVDGTRYGPFRGKLGPDPTGDPEFESWRMEMESNGAATGGRARSGEGWDDLSPQEDRLEATFPNDGWYEEKVATTGRREGRPTEGIIDPHDIQGLMERTYREHRSEVDRFESQTDKQNVLISLMCEGKPKPNMKALATMLKVPRQNVYRLKKRGDKVRQNWTNSVEANMQDQAALKRIEDKLDVLSALTIQRLLREHEETTGKDYPALPLPALEKAA